MYLNISHLYMNKKVLNFLINGEMKMKKTIKIGFSILLFSIMLMCSCKKYVQIGKYKYLNDPRINKAAMVDIEVDNNSIYGFVPSKDSKRLAEYANFDYSNKSQVEEMRNRRIKYHDQYKEMYEKWKELQKQNKTAEEIAHIISPMRNKIRFDSYGDDLASIEILKKSNLETYGNEYGPTPEQLYEKYGDWEIVTLKAFSANSGFDACLGLYDDEYVHNVMVGAVKEEVPVKYEVKENDNIDKIAKKYYGDKKYKNKIYDANKDIINKGEEVKVGQVLIIPID